MILDMKTIMVGFILSIGLQLFVFLLLWRQHKARYEGLSHWVLAFFLLFLSFSSIVLFDIYKYKFLIISINVFSISGLILLLFGLEIFFNKKRSILINSILFVAVLVSFLQFTYLTPSLRWRMIATASANLVIWLQIACLVLYRVNPADRKLGVQVGVFSLLLAVNTLFRMSLNLQINPGEYFYSIPLLMSWSFLAAQILFFGLSFSIFLLVSKRLNLDLNKDISRREILEEKLMKSERTARAIINASADSVFLVDINGNFIDMNTVTANLLKNEIGPLIGKSAYDILPSEVAVSQKKKVEETIQRREPVRYVEDRNGTVLDNIIYPIKNEAGEVDSVAVFARDITKEQRAELKLRENKIFLDSVLDSIQDGICVLDPDLNIVHVNKSMENIFESHQPFKERKCFAVLRGNQCPCDDCPAQRAMRSQKLEMQEMPLIKNGMEVGFLEVYAFPMFDENGTLVRVVEYIRNITLRKQAEEALKENEKRLRAFYTATFEGIVVTEHGIIKDYNRQLAELFGYEVDELLGKKVMELVVEEERELVSKNIRAGYEKSYDHRGLKKDGSVIYIEVHGQNIQYQGRPARVTAIHDLTEIKLAEMALKESERNMSTVLNNTQDVVVRIDSNYRHVFANPALFKATGLSPEQYLGKTNEEIGMPAELCDFWHEKHESVFRNGKSEIFQFVFSTVDEGERIFQAVVNPEFNREGAVETIISFMRDITELKNAELQKNAVIDELKHALDEIKTLRGFIPICANCKNIRNDEGYWQQVEEYISDRTEAEFSHSICPKCVKELYPDLEVK